MRANVRSKESEATAATPAVRRRRALLLATLCCTVVGSAVAQSGGSYLITRHAVAGGGGRASGGGFVLVGTVGQAETAAPASAAGLRLAGGFHAPAGAAPNALFSDGFEN